MVFFEDQVGIKATRARAEILEQAFAECRIVRERDTEWRDDLPVREESIPVVRAGPRGRRASPGIRTCR